MSEKGNQLYNSTVLNLCLLKRAGAPVSGHSSRGLICHIWITTVV